MERTLSESRRRLAAQNMGLVGTVLARLHIRRGNREYDDLQAAGYLGLCRAALRWREGWEPFSTFAAHLIAHEIVDCLRQTPPGIRAVQREPYADDPELGRVEDRMRIAALDAALPGLVEPRDARVGQMLLRGFSPGEIAERLAMSPAEVTRARRRAARALRRWEHTPSGRKDGADGKNPMD